MEEMGADLKKKGKRIAFREGGNRSLIREEEV